MKARRVQVSSLASQLYIQPGMAVVLLARHHPALQTLAAAHNTFAVDCAAAEEGAAEEEG